MLIPAYGIMLDLFTPTSHLPASADKIRVWGHCRFSRNNTAHLVLLCYFSYTFCVHLNAALL